MKNKVLAGLFAFMISTSMIAGNAGFALASQEDVTEAEESGETGGVSLSLAEHDEDTQADDAQEQEETETETEEKIEYETLETTVAEEGSSTKLTFRGDFSSSVSKEEGHYYYIPVLALSFEKGFTLRFYKADGTTYTYSYNSAVTFNQGRRRRLWVDLSQLPVQYTYARLTAAFSSPSNRSRI